MDEVVLTVGGVMPDLTPSADLVDDRRHRVLGDLVRSSPDVFHLLEAGTVMALANAFVLHR